MRVDRELTCYGCGQPIQPTCRALDEAGNVQDFPGEEYRIIDGRPWCEGCQLAQRREVSVRTYASQPVRDEAEEHDDGTVTFAEFSKKYIPPGSHGGSNKCKRFSGRKVGTKIEREAWGT